MEPLPGEGAVYWHVLLDSSEEVRDAARSIQARLATFGGFHMTPDNRLHLTTLYVGSTKGIGNDELDSMLSKARNVLGEVEPPNVTLRRILYHPEAIVLDVSPHEALEPIHRAVTNASIEALNQPHTELHGWKPHVTIAYSTAQQSMAPIVDALGRSIPQFSIDITSVQLVVQWGPERVWDWQTVGTVHLKTNVN